MYRYFTLGRATCGGQVAATLGTYRCESRYACSALKTLERNSCRIQESREYGHGSCIPKLEDTPSYDTPRGLYIQKRRAPREAGGAVQQQSHILQLHGKAAESDGRIDTHQHGIRNRHRGGSTWDMTGDEDDYVAAGRVELGDYMYYGFLGYQLCGCCAMSCHPQGGEI